MHGVDDIALVLQQNRLRWYGHVLQKDDDDWVKKCMEHEVEGPRPRGRPKKTYRPTRVVPDQRPLNGRCFTVLKRSIPDNFDSRTKTWFSIPFCDLILPLNRTSLFPDVLAETERDSVEFVSSHQ